MHKIRLSLLLLPLLAALILSVGKPSNVHAQDSQTCDYPSLKIGETAWLSALPEYSVPLYESASDQSVVIGAIAGGEIVSILEGPICNLRDVWWRVDYEGITGWIVGARVAMDYGMEVVSYSFDPITPCVSRFTVGDQAEGFDYGPRPIRAERDQWRGEILAEPDENALLNVVGEPVCSQYNRVLWVDVEWNGVRGWTQEWAHADQCDFYCASDLNVYLRAPLEIAAPLPLDAAVERVRALAVTPPTHPNSLTRDDFSRLEVLSQIGQGEIIDFALSPTLSDSTQLAIVGTVEVLIYDLRDLTAPIHTIDAHTSTPTTALYSPDGQTLVTADSRGHVYLWDTQTFAQLAKIERNERINRLAFSQDSALLAVATGEDVSIWDVQSSDEISLIYTSDDGHGATALEFIGDSHRLVAFDHSRGRVIDADDGAIIPLEHSIDHEPLWEILSWAIYPDGLELTAFTIVPIPTDAIMSRYTAYVTGWDLETGEEWLYSTDYTDPEYYVPGGVRLDFNPVTGERLLMLNGTQQVFQNENFYELQIGTVYSLAYSPDGSLMAFGRYDGLVILYDQQERVGELHGITDAVVDLAFTSDGAYLVGHGADNTVHVWDVEARTGVGSVQLIQLEAPVAPDDDGTLLYKDDERLTELSSRYDPLPTDYAGFYRFSPDYAYAADIDRLTDPTADSVIVVEVATGRELLRIERSFSLAFPKAFSDHGRLLAVVDAGREYTDDPNILTLWDVETGDLLFSYPESDFDVVFSPTQTVIAWIEYEYTPGTWDIKIFGFGIVTSSRRNCTPLALLKQELAL